MNQTLRHNGTSWSATNALRTDGNNVGIGIAPGSHKLMIGGTASMTGFRMPTGALTGNVLISSDDEGNGMWLNPLALCEACEEGTTALIQQEVNANKIVGELQDGSSIGTEPTFFAHNFILGSSQMGDPAHGDPAGLATRMIFDQTAGAAGAFMVGTSDNGAWDSHGPNSFSAGHNSVASGAGAMAAGIGSVASHQGAMALGEGAQAMGPNAVAMGLQVTATAANAVALGQLANASNIGAMAMGFNSAASGMYAMSFHGNASGDSSMAVFGLAEGEMAVAIGHNSVSQGLSALALGFRDSAIGDHAIAIGYESVAKGYAASAVGNFAKAEGNSSMAFGNYARARDIQAFALGNNTQANGLRSFALGNDVQSRSAYEVIIGRFESNHSPLHTKQWQPGDRLFTIANGQSDSQRSDAFVVRKNGRAGIGSASTDAQLHVSGLDGLLVTGTLGQGEDFVNTNIVNQTKMLFYPKKGAFRVGENGSGGFTRWDNENIGFHSFAAGFNVMAKGHRSVAMGHDVLAQSNYEVALGVWNTEYTPQNNNTDRILSVGNGAGSGANRSDAFVILKNGNTGIGISSPSTKLNVTGGNWNLNTTDGDFLIGSGDHKFKFSMSVGGAGAGVARINSMSSGSAESVRIGAGGNDVLHVSNSNVGIGIVPTHKLHVSGGDARINSITVGRGSGNSNTNTVFGRDAFSSNTSGTDNTIVGVAAGAEVTTGSRNVAFGNNAFSTNSSGSFNTAIGMNALMNYSSGADNTAIGEGAGAGISGITLNNCTFIGSLSSVSVSRTNVTMIGSGISNTQITANNQVAIGNASVTQLRAAVTGITAYSDARYKANVSEDVSGLAFINKLKPVTYNVRPQELHRIWGTPDSLLRRMPDSKEAETVRHIGFIAQDVEKAAQESGFDFPGLDRPRNPSEVYTLRYTDFIMPLVKSVQELDRKVERMSPSSAVSESALRAENEELRQRLSKLEAQMEGLLNSRR